MFKLATLAILLAFFGTSIVSAISYREILEEEWNVFKQVYNKSYEKDENQFRFKVFMENKHMIARHNQKANAGHKSYKLEINHYGDMLHHEFVRMMNGYKHQLKSTSENGSLFMTPEHVHVPESIDWRKHGRVSPVKNQGQCGSCWSFSSTGALEGQHARKTGRLVSLSEQNLIDCSTKYGNHGCNGGLMDFAFQYIKSNHGIDTEASYPYEAKEGKCRYSKRNSGATDTGFVDVPQGDEKRLKEAVATVGPVSIAIDASQPTFQFYNEGIYDEPECSSTELDHGVLVVGYGTDEDGKDYWLVKNSWGTKWGEKGYVRMARNKHNQCGVATAASYPLV
ncbi:hypothetical protein RDWZM_010115 [Blomia tropicalis]|uniref:Cathepsin L n=1 Tax=Blomia tropicalis TaxID=40697 RepID=A0A9Q0M139_BLOTA|nr:hypothetical protein RDWZM_010115 [Blomia tropicalis]